MSALLEMRGITKAYGAVQANAGIDFDVFAGSVVGLLGENGSGKSTLMNILFGVVPPDAGSIVFKGHELSGHLPSDSMNAGIGIVHQHFMLINSMSVTENILLGLRRHGWRLHKRETARAIRQASEQYGLDLDPDARIGDLPLGRRQRVEIVKALMRGVDLLILDEPTSNLSPPEVSGLFRVIRRLREEGKAIVFISHKIDEVLAICDRIIVLRDGCVIGGRDCADATPADLARLMVGRDVTEPLERGDHAFGVPQLQLRNIVFAPRNENRPEGVSQGISFDVRSGEILAIAGVDGNGQVELAEAIAGIRAIKNGRILIGDADLTKCGVATRMKAGLAYLPADRGHTSLVPALTVAENLMLRDSHRLPFSRRSWLNRRKIAEKARGIIWTYGIRAPSPDIATSQLSGGNQQKIAVARELERQPKVFVALQATWGLDPGATRFVMERMLELRHAGGAILYISSQLDEALALGDRIGVMFRGRLVGILPRDHATAERVGLMMGGATGVLL